MSIEDLSLRELKKFESEIPGLAGFPSRFLVNTYEDFIQILYRDLDDIVADLQENPELCQNDGEDRLTIDIVRMLRRSGYIASHDAKIGGHTDLSVRKKNFLWIGEAKIYGSSNNLWEGFLQLTTRYSTGDTHQRDGGLIIYIRVENAASVMENWQKYLIEKNLKDCEIAQCPLRQLSFFSTHEHSRSGKPFCVRHIPVLLYFNPEDKSGRKRG